MKKFDVICLGGGPGGYTAAIRASQLGFSVALIEQDKLGGVCLNRGCIPTKALLKSAHAVHEVKKMSDLGVKVNLVELQSDVAVERSGKIADRLSKGVSFLMKKNKISVFSGKGVFKDSHLIEVSDSKGQTEVLEGKNIILATGAHYRSFPSLEHDGKRLIGAYEALKLKSLPSRIAIIGGGAIGCEFAYFWNAFGVDVHIFELQDHLLPIEDEESSLVLEKAYQKSGIKLSLGLEKVSTKNNGDDISVFFKDKNQSEELKFDMALIAVGMIGNLEGYGLEKVGIETQKGFISVNSYYQTNLPHIYAIGDFSGPPLLAHAASHEGIIAAEHIAHHDPRPLDKMNIPGCTYSYPQVASVGHTEKELKEMGVEYKVGKLPFIANGKALASNEKEGHIKTLIGKYGELLGAHIVGEQATELIHEYVLFRTMEGIDEEIFATVHPHPTLGEWLGEAVMAAQGRSINF